MRTDGVGVLIRRRGSPRASRSRALALVFATAFTTLAVACADPPPDAAAGRLQTLPGDAGGAELIAADASTTLIDAAAPDATVGGGDLDDAGTPDGL